MLDLLLVHSEEPWNQGQALLLDEVQDVGYPFGPQIYGCNNYKQIGLIRFVC